jgi:hypothetical protein
LNYCAGGTGIEYYEVEKLDPETGLWVPVGRCTEPQMDVTGLTPGQEYKMRVKAVNKEVGCSREYLNHLNHSI